jgi:adenylate kinase
MRLLMQGSPGAGKGTHGRRLAADLGIPHIATGDLLREQVALDTSLGRAAKDYVDRGDYVPDDVMVEMIRLRLSEPDAQRGFILDGYPRTDAQATELDKLLADAGHAVDAVILLEVPVEDIVRRLSARRMCPVCQRNYSMVDNPPKDDERCDDDGSELITRTDDEPDTVRRRLKVYADRTADLLDHYDDGIVRRVDGTASVDEVIERIDEVLGLASR